MSARKELQFFGTDIVLGRPRLTEDQYMANFSTARNETMVGESSAWYFVSERAPIEIKEFNPSAKIIVLFRNPVDMLYSLHNQSVRSELENIRDFEAALEAEEGRGRGLHIPDNIWVRQRLFYSEVASYGKHLRRYVNVFGWDRIHVIITDDLRDNPAETYSSVLRFLGVRDDFLPQFRVVNASRHYRNESLRLLARHPDFITRRVVMAILPRSIRRRITKALHWINTDISPQPPMKPELRMRLTEKYAPEVQALGELIGRDLSHWSK